MSHYIAVDQFGALCAPLYLLDHSGLRLDMAPFCDPWDSGQVGWIYVEDDMALRSIS